MIHAKNISNEVRLPVSNGGVHFGYSGDRRRKATPTTGMWRSLAIPIPLLVLWASETNISDAVKVPARKYYFLAIKRYRHTMDATSLFGSGISKCRNGANLIQRWRIYRRKRPVRIANIQRISLPEFKTSSTNAHYYRSVKWRTEYYQFECIKARWLLLVSMTKGYVQTCGWEGRTFFLETFIMNVGDGLAIGTANPDE